MCEVTPYMVNVATKRGISVIYHSLLWYISYIPQRGTFDLNHRCGIYIYTTLAWAFKGAARCLTHIFPGQYHVKAVCQ